MKTNQRPTLPTPPPLACPQPVSRKEQIIVCVLFACLIALALGVMLVNITHAKASNTTACGSSFPSARYISPWTVIPQNSEVEFRHGFKCHPIQLDIWVQTSQSAPDGSMIIVPYQEQKGSIKVIAVTWSIIRIKNTTDHPITVEVVAYQ